MASLLRNLTRRTLRSLALPGNARIEGVGGLAALLARVSAFAGTINLPGVDGSVFQETTGASATTPASADGDAVGSLKNLGTRGGFRTAASSPSRPTLKIVSGKKLLRFDGSDDVLSNADPYLYAAGSAGIFFAINAGLQAATSHMFGETSSAAIAPLYNPGFRFPTSDQCTAFLRNDANTTVISSVSVGGTYAGGPRIIGVVDTGSQLVPYDSKTAGTAVGYTRSGTLTLDRSNLGALVGISASNWAAFDCYGLIAMAGVPTAQQISDIVDLLSLEAGI